jgi:hypothetical protein
MLESVAKECGVCVKPATPPVASAFRRALSESSKCPPEGGRYRSELIIKCFCECHNSGS